MPDDPAPVLAGLIAGGLVTHEMIGDPALLGAEAPVLDRLCALVGGAIYRLGPFHYAFRAGPSDLDGRLAEADPGAWTGMLEAALCADLGAEAVWLGVPDLPADPPAETPTAAAPEPLPLETAQAEDAGAGTALDRRLGAIEGMLDAILARLGAPDPLRARLDELLARLDDGDLRGGDLAEHLAEHLTLRLGGALAGRAAADRSGQTVFEQNLGLILAEFLARLEQREARPAAPPRPV